MIDQPIMDDVITQAKHPMSTAMASSAGKHFLGRIRLTSPLYGQKIGHLGAQQTFRFSF